MLHAHLGQLCLLAITAAWGTTFLVMAELQHSWLPWPMMATRFCLGTAVLLPLLPWARFGRRSLRHGSLLGLLATLGFALQTLSMRLTTEAHCAFCTSLITVFVPALEALQKRQRLQRSTLLGMGAALLGMLLLLSGNGPLAPLAGTPPELHAGPLGDLLGVLGALAFAAQIVLLERLSHRSPMLPLLIAELATVAALSLLGMAVFGQGLPPLTRPSFALLLYLGVVASALCFLGQIWGQARTPPTQAAFIYATEPLFAAALAWAWHGQAMQPPELCGGVLIFMAAMLAEGPAARFVNRRPFAAPP